MTVRPLPDAVCIGSSKCGTTSLRRLHRLLASMFEGLGIGRFESRLLDAPAFEPRYTDCAHSTGATRMSRSDRARLLSRAPRAR